ncbi:hypothetical protein [Streptomyces sp. NPDC097610]|uniref:hypothetical protein n=1 Tax=Streptomyces sp. NPDC097610 TaxID=3157227 RepID=UPI0033347719
MFDTTVLFDHPLSIIARRRGRMRQRTAQVVRNPVLAGSRPDPSILRVGADSYLAASTFE